MTKFLSVGTNVKFRRIYDGSKKVIFDLKMKPAINLGLGRKSTGKHLASLMFCDDHLRVNHFQTIDKNGTVSYGLKTKPKTDETHDIELKIESDQREFFFSIRWNNIWHANIAMSSEALTITPTQ